MHYAILHAKLFIIESIEQYALSLFDSQRVVNTWFEIKETPLPVKPEEGRLIFKGETENIKTSSTASQTYKLN